MMNVSVQDATSSDTEEIGNPAQACSKYLLTASEHFPNDSGVRLNRKMFPRFARRVYFAACMK